MNIRVSLRLFRPRTTVSQRAAVVAMTVALINCGGAPESTGADGFGAESVAVEGPSVRIGSLDDPEFAFSAVSALVEAPNGHLYSLHRGEAAIRRWTTQGDPAGQVGREGEGPGEFTNPRALGIFGDTLWVMDGRAYRASYFDLEGEFLGSTSPIVDLGGDPDRPHASPARPVRPLRDGSFYGQAPAWSDAIAKGELTETMHAHMDESGRVVATAWTQPFTDHDVLALLRDGGGTFFQQPFGDQPLFGLGPDEALLIVDRRVRETSKPKAIWITKVTMAGDTAFQTEVPYSPVALDASRVDSAAAALAEGFHEFASQRQPGLTLGQLEQDIRAATFAPVHLPAVRGLVLAKSGDIWLQEFDATSSGTGWMVFGPTGDSIGRVITPPDLRVLLIEDRHLWGVETDELDVNYIVRYELPSVGPLETNE